MGDQRLTKAIYRNEHGKVVMFVTRENTDVPGASHLRDKDPPTTVFMKSELTAPVSVAT